ncbi:hypothetical protein Z042_25795 [Chania multitudinisentens RB-25]|uniref:YjiS-like domain-containing protein n=1 Tax=Chania multitudinisentens RB-25 TaxID=1441930 RepID=A0A0D4ZXR0_9GAMM|nr:DUF1127 domain-containing protein [Chania multitudinisentens]AJW28914.1 hypothetical protein Z042_25795 [Chania multitudinisentens RB-25]
MDGLLEEANEHRQSDAVGKRKFSTWLLQCWRAWLNRCAAKKALAAMSDEQLRDIGLRRSDVERGSHNRNYERRPW